MELKFEGGFKDVFEHDFKKHPELTNRQLQLLEIFSPHKQIKESFWGRVVKVTDGDTVRLEWTERDFDFPLRIDKIAAPELQEIGGLESQRWLASQVLGKEVYIKIDKNNRVGKWGRLIGEIIHSGINIGELSKQVGYSVEFDKRGDGLVPTLDQIFN